MKRPLQDPTWVRWDAHRLSRQRAARVGRHSGDQCFLAGDGWRVGCVLAQPCRRWRYPTCSPADAGRRTGGRVLLNILFGLAAAWAIGRFRFPGRTFLLSLIDLPFAVSPVVAGLMFVLLFGMSGYLGPWLASMGIRVIFAVPGLIIVTTFVTLPFIARELIPLMEALGEDEELAALSLGANGWQIFWYVTMPNVQWGLLYGVILCNARAMGEFGAVSVVSGGVAGAH